MATTPTQEKSGQLNLTAIDITSPPKALTPFDTPSSSTMGTPAEKVIELRRDSGPSTPLSSRNENPFDTDIEAMITTTTSGEALGPRKSCAAVEKKDCPSVWPNMQQWKQKAKTAKKTRRTTCNCLAGLSKRNRIIVKVLIILLIVGVGLGVGFGVSKSLNAPIWGDKDSEK